MINTLYKIRERATAYTESEIVTAHQLKEALDEITALATGALESTRLNYAHVGEAFKTHSLRGCARCGHDHSDILWMPLTQPVEDPDGTKWTHWASCPTNGQPILMRATEEEPESKTAETAEKVVEQPDQRERSNFYE